MKLLASIGHFMIGLGVLLHAVTSCVVTWLTIRQTNEMGHGTPPGTYEDDTKWDFDEY